MNYIPIIGWVIDFVLKAILAVPFWFFWTICGIGRNYFGFLPDQFIDIPFWPCVGVFVVLGIIKSVSPFSSSAFANSSSDKKTKKVPQKKTEEVEGK